MIKFLVHSFLPLTLFISSILPMAVHAEPGTRPHPGAGATIEVGGGGMDSGADGMELLFRVEGAYSPSGLEDEFSYVVARVSGDFSGGLDRVSFIDFQLNAFSYGLTTSNGFTAVDLGNVDIQRNIAIDNAHLIRVTLVGLRTDRAFKMSENTRYLLSFSLDLAGFAVNERLSDGAVQHAERGTTYGGRLETGVEWLGRFRVLLGGKLDSLSGGERTVSFTESECRAKGYTPYVDGAYRGCSATVLDETRELTSAHLEVSARLIESLKLFGRADYQLFSVGSARADVRDGRTGGWTFRFGGSVRVRGRN